ncbi:class I SAM-dependent methyltransferase [candidate division WOR-3 bacterium]|nr:class I SAM-dependent methyltransferase [candidate division WOR-3 bacterium]
MSMQNADLGLKEDRKLREKIFHDEIFEAKARRKVSKYYSFNESIRQKFIELLSDCASKNILEIGCGLGLFAISMASKGARVSAIDISEYAIKTAKQKATKENLEIDFRIMDAESLKFRNNDFELIYGISILHHLDLKRVIPEIKRVIKIGGKAIFIEPMEHNPFIKTFRFLTPRLRSKDEHPLRMKDLQLISKRFPGYEFKYYYFLALFAFPFCKFPFYDKIQHFFERLDRKIFAIIPSLKKFSWQVLLILEK